MVQTNTVVVLALIVVLALVVAIAIWRSTAQPVVLRQQFTSVIKDSSLGIIQTSVRQLNILPETTVEGAEVTVGTPTVPVGSTLTIKNPSPNNVFVRQGSGAVLTSTPALPGAEPQPGIIANDIVLLSGESVTFSLADPNQYVITRRA